MEAVVDKSINSNIAVVITTVIILKIPVIMMREVLEYLYL
jgi:hypothetical protein